MTTCAVLDLAALLPITAIAGPTFNQSLNHFLPLVLKVVVPSETPLSISRARVVSTSITVHPKASLSTCLPLLPRIFRKLLQLCHQAVSDKYSSYKYIVYFELTRLTGSTTDPNAAVTNTGTSSPSTTSNSGGKYSTSDKIAIGVGLGVGIPAIVVAILAWWFPCGQRRVRVSSAGKDVRFHVSN
jgi:hypothetical protein